ncbi:MAG: hypothetical protein ACC645_06215, partial [Pirellulales bacterium]
MTGDEMSRDTEVLLELFFGEATATEARVYVRAECERSADVRLTGTVWGPHSTIARTLPARLDLRDLGVDREADRPPARLAEAILPDPCFWLPQRPYWYDVEIAVRRGDTPIVEVQRRLGIRPFGARGTDLLLEGRRWVMRGAVARSGDRRLAQTACREEVCLMIRDPSDELLDEASRFGVLLVADFDHDPGDDGVAAQLERLARWPAVAMTRLPAASDPRRWRRRPPRNLLLAQRFGPDDPVQVAPWAAVAVVEDHDPTRLARRTAGIGVPVVAVSLGVRPVGGGAIWRGCDSLQRTLVPHGD